MCTVLCGLGEEQKHIGLQLFMATAVHGALVSRLFEVRAPCEIMAVGARVPGTAWDIHFGPFLLLGDLDLQG